MWSQRIRASCSKAIHPVRNHTGIGNTFFACDIIAASVEAVGGRYMIIECRDTEKLIRFYQNNSFKEISRIPDKDQPMVQMIRKIQ